MGHQSQTPNHWSCGELPRGGARPAVEKLDEEMMRQTLVDIVERYPAFTLLQINAELCVRLPAKPEISITTISSSLDGQSILDEKIGGRAGRSQQCTHKTR